MDKGRTPEWVDHWKSGDSQAALCTLEADYFGSPFRRRMTLVRLSSGGVLLHSPILLSEADRKKCIDSMGEVIGIIAPNSFHCDDTPAYAEIYPRAQVVVPASRVKDLSKKGRVDQTLSEELPSTWAQELQKLCLQGMRKFFEEAIFFHRPSRTLLVTDLVFHLDGELYTERLSWLERKFWKWNRISDGRFGASRLFRDFFAKDRKALEESLAQILEWDFDRVVMSHGNVLEAGGKSRFRESFEELGFRF